MGIKATTTLTSKGQVTLPKAVRDRLGLRAGDKIEFVEDDEGFYLRNVQTPNRYINLLGYLAELEGQDPDQLTDDWRGR